MKMLSLCTPREAETLVARLFARSQRCIVYASDDKAFKDDDLLNLGEIELFSSGNRREEIRAAVRRGAFEWSVPRATEAESALAKVLAHEDLGQREAEKASGKLHRVLDAIAAICVRIGLRHPIFDPDALEVMPFRRSTTVVADTSGAIQGGLDFVARYLHPAARVKVPAIVQMEIVNFAERFFGNRRAAKVRRTDLLLDHLVSQGGQRVLLRLELQADTEVERTFLLGDPLRSAFQRDTDPDISELSLSTPIRAYADRLVLEAARHHQAQANIGHSVQLLTSDQGLARMALAEGLRPLFFRSVVASDFFERRLTGAMLHPFNGQLREVGITEIIWELATAFGSATLKTLDGVHKVTIAAIGDNLAWSPYQSHGDLLWADVSQTPDWPNQAQTNQAQSENSMNSQLGDTASIERRPAETARQDEDPQGPVRLQPRDATFERAAPQRFNVGSLFLVLDALDNEQILSEDQLMKLVGVKRREGIADYRRFLASAGAIETGDGDWKAKPLAQELTVALRNEDIPKLRACLKLAPSFGEWARQIEQQPLGEPCDSKGLGRAQRTYLTLAEVTQIGAPIFGKGFYPTPSMPDTAAFATIAIDRFDQLDRDEGLVATGAWLEALVQQDGIHPEVARNRLNDASASGLIRRTTEGSTTEVRFDKHVIQVLRIRNGIPIVLTVHLYRGDYLIPGKSSTSLRIERPLP